MMPHSELLFQKSCRLHLIFNAIRQNFHFFDFFVKNYCKIPANVV